MVLILKIQFLAFRSMLSTTQKLFINDLLFIKCIFNTQKFSQHFNHAQWRFTLYSTTLSLTNYISKKVVQRQLQKKKNYFHFHEVMPYILGT